MTMPLLHQNGIVEIEGTAEEIQARLADFAGQRLHVTVQAVLPPIETVPELPPRKLSITEKITERFRDVPPEERSKVPADLSDNLDHYIYGLPKK